MGKEGGREGEVGRERGYGSQEPVPKESVPDWQADKEGGGVVHGYVRHTESSLKHQVMPVCGAVSIRPAYC